jgi:hypothetical protein
LSSKKQLSAHEIRPSFVAIVAPETEFAEKRVHRKRCVSHEASKFTGALAHRLKSGVRFRQKWRCGHKIGCCMQLQPKWARRASKFVSVRLKCCVLVTSSCRLCLCVRVCLKSVCWAAKSRLFAQNRASGALSRTQKQLSVHEIRPSFVAIVAPDARFAKKWVQTKRCDSCEASKFRGFPHTD